MAPLQWAPPSSPGIWQDIEETIALLCWWCWMCIGNFMVQLIHLSNTGWLVLQCHGASVVSNQHGTNRSKTHLKIRPHHCQLLVFCPRFWVGPSRSVLAVSSLWQIEFGLWIQLHEDPAQQGWGKLSWDGISNTAEGPHHWPSMDL